MRTANKATQLGLYASACCDAEALFDRNDTLSRCPECESLCFWQFVEPVVSWKDMDNSADEPLPRAA